MSRQASQSEFESGLNQSLQNLATAPQAAAASASSQVKSQLTIDYKELKLGASKGKGAYGEVFVGEYRKEPVAIKIYDFRGQLSERERAEMFHEAELMEGLRSKYLVSFRGICWDPHYCLVMEYCEGGTLRARLNQTDQALNPIDQLRWAQQMSYGLYHLHSIKIIHRDLKGENILLDSHGDAKLADFGLSVVKSSSASQSRSGGGQIAGTIPWMAPELFESKPNNSAADVYSLGMVLWEIVSRKSPFTGLMPPVVVGMIMMGKRETIDPSWPVIFRTLIQACWDAEPSKRPTAEKVGDELTAALSSVEAVPKPVSQTPEQLRIAHLEEKLRQAELKNQQLQHQQLPLVPASPVASPSKPSDLPSSASSVAQNSQSLMPAPKTAVPAVDVKALGKLLQLVVEGEQDQAEELIKENSKLLLTAGSVTDLSGRTFNNITAFQYALWAMDWHMWTMIQKYLPKAAQVEQFNVLESKETEHCKHYDIKPLTDALQTYLDNAEKWNYDKRAEEHWCKKVGGSQRMVPAHVVNEYCRKDYQFYYPSSKNWESKLLRTRKVEVFTGSKYVSGDWFVAPSSTKSLGSTFAFHCLYDSYCAGLNATSIPRPSRTGKTSGSIYDYHVELRLQIPELKALRSLWKTRTKQLKLLSAEYAAVSSPSQQVGLWQKLFG